MRRNTSVRAWSPAFDVRFSGTVLLISTVCAQSAQCFNIAVPSSIDEPLLEMQMSLRGEAAQLF